MTPFLSRLTDLIPFERKKKSLRAHVPLYTGWGMGVDGWLWSSILRNRNLPDDRIGYAMAYLLVPEIRTCVDIYVDQIERIAWAIQQNPGWDARNDNEIARSTDKKDRHPFQRAMTRHRQDLSIGFLRRLAYMLLLFDEVYVLPEVNDYGLVSDLTVLNNLAIQPQVQSGYLQWVDYFSSGGGTAKYRPSELAIDHGFNPMDDFRGSSLVMTAIDSINVLRNLVAYLNEFFVNNARMGLVGSTSEPLSAEQLTQLRQTITDFLKGKGNQFRTFISPVPVDWTAFENPDIEKQFNIDAPMVEKIFRAFRVPLALAGDLQGTRYKESADVDAIFIKRSVAPILKNVQEFINDSLLPYFVERTASGQIDQRFEFDLSEFDSLTEGDKLQNDIVNQNVTAGLIPIAQAQELAGYEPDEALKEYYMLQGIPVPKPVYLNYYKKQFGVDESGNVPQEPLSVGGKLLPRPALPGVNGNGSDNGEKPALPAGEAFPDRDGDGIHDHSVTQRLVNAERDGLEAAQAIAYTRSVYNPDSDTVTYFVDAPADIAAKIQPSPEEEWRAWRKVALKSPTRDFTTYWLSGDLADTLRADLAASGADKGQIVAAFDRALEQIHYRAIQATRLDFEMRFEDVLREIRGGDLNDRRRAGTLFRSMIRLFGTRAYRDGLVDGGVLDGELDDEDTAELNSLIAEQSQYVSAFTEVLIKQDGISDNEAALKPTIWWTKSVLPIYQAGLASADRNSIYEWILGRTREHCRDCLRLNGQRHRLRDYRRKGFLPGSDMLECNGYYCGCSIAKVSAKARGSW